jgi:hypothetical protein
MPRPYLRALALTLAAAAPVFASRPVTRAEALDAVRAFESGAAAGVTASKAPRQASEAIAGASNTIVRYALESADVVVDLGSSSVPWLDAGGDLAAVARSGERGVLLVAYLSGSIRAQLESGRQDPNPYPGWVAMLRLYHALKIREGVAIPEIDVLAARQMDGTLESYAASAVERSRESLRRTYGTGGSRTKQVVAASQP